MSITSLPELTGNFGKIYQDFTKWERFKYLIKLLLKRKMDKDKCLDELKDLGFSQSQADSIITNQLTRL